jgi:nucleoside 2-deoxyribosyltransferase
MSIDCPVCKLDKEHAKSSVLGLRYRFDCARCGAFEVSTSAGAMLASRPAHFGLSAWIRSRTLYGSALPLITSENLDTLLSEVPKYKVSEKQLMFLRTLEHQTPYAGKEVTVIPEFDCTLAWCNSAEELQFMVRALMSRDLVSLGKGLLDPKDSFVLELTITPRGWSFLDESARPAVLLNQVFVAMSFDKQLLSAWAEGIGPAVRRAKFEPYRVDIQPHIDRIDSKIVAEIKNSRFLIADVTQQRPGVYFEAGFAIGLGLPVFWCVRDDDLKNVHFDTRQYNHVVWSTEVQLAEELYTRIAAVVGHGTAT